MLDAFTQSLTLIMLQTQANYLNLLIILAVVWGAFILTRLIPNLLILGIIPRNAFGLLGLLFAPLLHGNFNHLFFNSIPLVVLSNFLLMNGITYYLQVTLEITVLSGFLVWCFGKPGLHIGASAVITGYWGLLVCEMYQQGSLISIILGIVCIYYFAGIFLGIFPSKKGVSWEGHLFGLIAGIVVSQHWI